MRKSIRIKKFNLSRLSMLMMGVGLAGYAALPAQALNITWDANNTGAGLTDGAGTWLNANQWRDGASNVTWNSGTPDSAIIGNGGAGGAITLGGNVTAGTISMGNNTGTYTVQGTAQTLTVNTGITVSGAGNVTFRGTAVSPNGLTIAGAGGITMNGTGVLNLRENVTNSYTGATVINNGVLLVFNNKAAGNFTLNGGMLTDYFQQTTVFTSGLGTGNNQIQIYGNSGFGAGNGTSTWRIGATGSTLVWGGLGDGSATGFFNPTTLRLRAPIGDNNGPSIYGITNIDNRIDLNSGARTINVFHGTGSPSSSRAIIDDGIQDTGGLGSLTKIGGGMLIINGATSTWGGSTTVSAGILDFTGNNENNIGGGSARNISVATGAGIRFNALSNAILNRIVENSNEIAVMTGTTANNLDFSSSTGANLPNAFLGNFASNGAKMEYSGTITPGSSGYKLGAIGSSGLLGIVGTNKLTGSAGLTVGQTGSTGIRVELAGANDFTGDTVINTGSKLTLGNNLALQNSVLNLGSAGGTFALSDGTNAGRITGDVAAPSPTFGGLAGSRSLFSAFSSTAGNNETLLANTAVTGFTLNVGTGNTVTYSGAIGGFGTGASGGINGNSTLTKTGAGTQILSGVSTYSGATNVNGGTLRVNGTLANTSVVNVNNGGTLGGTGTINNLAILNLNNGGTLSPGASIESLNTGSNIWTGSSNFVFEFSTDGFTGTAGTQWDLLAITGGLTMTNATTITLDLVTMLNTTNPGPLATWDPSVSTVWSGFVTTTTGVIGFDATKFAFNTSSFQNPLNGTFAVALNGNNFDLIYTTALVIPEPATATLAALGLTGLLMRRRRMA